MSYVALYEEWLQYDNGDLTVSMFNNLISERGVNNVFGIMCIINRNGKSLNFNLLKEDARLVKVFLGESFTGNISAKTSIDLYAFDLNYKIINV